MTICNCCGQQIETRTEARSAETTYAIWADEVLIQCCRNAQHIAQAQAANQVEIAHFVQALAQSTEALSHFVDRDLGALAAAAARATSTVGTARSPGTTPSMSSDMLTILDRAQQQAQSIGRESVTLELVVGTLLNDSRDLQSSQFLRDVRSDTGTWSAGSGNHRQSNQVSGHVQRDQREHGYSPNVSSSIGPADPFQLRLDTNRDDEWRDCENDPSDREAVASSLTPDDRSERDRSRGQRRRQDRPRHDRAQHRERSRHGSRASEYQNRVDPPLATEANVDTIEAMKDFDRRLQDMQRLLADVASQTKAIQSVQQQRDDRASAANSNTAADRNIVLSVDDMARLERLLKRLEKQDGTNSAARGRTGNESGSDRDRNRQVRGDRPLRRAWRRRSLRRGHAGERSSRDHTRLRGDNDGGSPNERTWNGRNSTTRYEDRSTGKRNNERNGTEWLNVDDGAGEGDPQAKRFYLEIDDEIVSAPSIGPRTAERLTPHGIRQVRDLLAADAADLAERVSARHITSQRIEDWQMQARLVCTIPWLRGTHAQLLVGSGYTTPGDINEADINTLCADILQFAGTRDGQRILRSGPPPEMEKIVKWAEFSAQAELDRAA